MLFLTKWPILNSDIMAENTKSAVLAQPIFPGRLISGANTLKTASSCRFSLWMLSKKCSVVLSAERFWISLIRSSFSFSVKEKSTKRSTILSIMGFFTCKLMSFRQIGHSCERTAQWLRQSWQKVWKHSWRETA